MTSSSPRDRTGEPIDLEGDLRDHLHGLAEWDGPIPDAAPDWLIAAILEFVQPVLNERDAEIEHLRKRLAPAEAVTARVKTVAEVWRSIPDRARVAEELSAAIAIAETRDAEARIARGEV